MRFSIPQIPADAKSMSCHFAPVASIIWRNNKWAQMDQHFQNLPRMKSALKTTVFHHVNTPRYGKNKEQRSGFPQPHYQARERKWSALILESSRSLRTSRRHRVLKLGCGPVRSEGRCVSDDSICTCQRLHVGLWRSVYNS